MTPTPSGSLSEELTVLAIDDSIPHGQRRWRIKLAAESVAAMEQENHQLQVARIEAVEMFLTERSQHQESKAEVERLKAELVVVKAHKVLSLLGKSSYQEVVEERLRVELAETQVAKEAAEAALLLCQQERDELRRALMNISISAVNRPNWKTLSNQELIQDAEGDLSAVVQAHADLETELAASRQTLDDTAKFIQQRLDAWAALSTSATRLQVMSELGVVLQRLWATQLSALTGSGETRRAEP